MEMNDNKKYLDKKKNKHTKYHFGYYYSVYGLAIQLFKGKYKPVIDKKAFEEMDKPCLIFANHGSVFDFILAGSVIMPKKAVFVTTKRTMFNKGSNWVVNKSPHILRDQFTADVKSIMEMRDALKQGYNIVLYPEGKVSTCGVTNRIPKATSKLVKMFKVPVVTIVSSGNWLIKPSWASHLRVGPVEVKSKLILTEEDINKLKAEEIQQIIEKELAHNENEYQIDNDYEFYNIKKRFGFAEGLEKILYKCPICGKEFTMDTKDDDIFCKDCGFKATYHHNGLLTSENEAFKFNRIDKWFDYERGSLYKELQQDDFMLSCVVEGMIENEKSNRYDSLGNGTLTLDKSEIKFTGENGLNLIYKIDKVEAIPFVVGVKICLLIDSVNYEFIFRDKLMSTKYDMAVELLSGERDAKKKERSSK